MPTCSVKWCGKCTKSSSYAKDGITFHRFPKCPEIKDKWIDATSRGKGWFPSYSNVICSRHFTEDSFHLMKNRRRLMDTALPSLYLPVLVPSPTNPNNASMTEQLLIPSSSEILSCKSVCTASSSQDKVQHMTSKNLAEGSETPTIELPESPAYDSPTEKRLCRRIIELQNTVKNKNKIIKKVRDSNRGLRSRLNTLESLFRE